MLNRVAALGRRFVEDTWLNRQRERIYLLMGGHIFFQTLSAAVEFDLFSLLADHPGLTCTEIAERLSIASKPARILLLGCTTTGLLRKKGARYHNTRFGGRLFSKQFDGNLIPIVRWQHYINYKAMYHFSDAIRANRNVGLNEFSGDEPTLYERLRHQPQLELYFQEAMQAISNQANDMLARFVDFSATRHLVDVGGGNGSNIITLAKKYSTLKATVFDSESVCRIARRSIDAAGLSDRLDAVAGDCFKDPFPPGADCFLFAHFFTIWSEEKNQFLLNKCFQALPAGGAVAIFNMMQRNDETGPFSAAMGSPYFLTLATGEGMIYCQREYKTWLQHAGFDQVEEYILPRDHRVLIGKKR
jgi:ubiquinone/menaquinone biosynthesis C-methylase UbiE